MFSGCVNKRSESVDVTDVKKELSEWFPDQKGPYHVKHIHECQYLCTIRPMEIRHLIYFASIINSVIYQQGPSWPWSYGSWIYNYLCNQCLSALMLWVQISIRARCTTKCDKVCQWLATGRCFSPGTTISSTNKTDRHDITEILLKVALNTIKQTNKIYQHFL